ncbi:uncharacterized protein [Drosophila pseudoobscura]|uniref:Uncharacterized protein isoform X1 n=1 Tax=Drosophila pseudoobscura pseudoobscura TaxID=46245 RepID=A0A6I8VUK8_DROPS|nr:uncharacterized protein LOC26534076 isoform X1 [Drosophila pseudoobscura]
MKASCYLFIILGLMLHLALSSGSGSTTEGFDHPESTSLTRAKQSSRRTQTCRKEVQSSCTSKTKACARLGRANICQAFKNDCQRRISNCNSKGLSIFYRKVSANLCKNMPYDKKLPCGSGSNALSGSSGATSNNNNNGSQIRPGGIKAIKESG